MSRFIKLGLGGEHLPADATEFFATLNAETGFATPAEDLFPERMPYADALQAIAKLNETKYGGLSAWRLGMVRTHVADLDYSRFDPAIDKALFPSAKSGWVWTEEACPEETWSAVLVFVVYFDYGLVYHGHRGDKAFVRPVCAVPSSGQ